MKRGVIIGALAATGAAAAILAGALLLHTRESPFSIFDLQPESPKSAEVCLKSGIPFVEGATKRCYAPSDVGALMDKAVLNDEGKAVTVDLSHPTETAKAPMPVGNCADYLSRKRAGWFALTSHDMRREAYFERACGALDLLAEARPAEVSYFSGDECSDRDVKSLAEGGAFWIGEGPGDARAEVARGDDNKWTISARGQIAEVQEIAHADFNGDARGDMLVFIYVRAEGGTAAAGAVGLLDKAGRDAPVVFIRR